MAPRLLMAVEVARKVAAASRAARAPAAPARRAARLGAGTRDLALESYAARHPQIYVTGNASKGPQPRGVHCYGSLEGSNTFAGFVDQQCRKVMSPYGPTTKVVFEAEEKDLKSDEALWALYQRWCKHFKMQRDRDEMAHYFDKFKYSVHLVQKVNSSDLPYKLEINKFAGKLTENSDSQAMLTRRSMAWRNVQKELRQVRSLEEEWEKEVESSSITTCPEACT